MQEQTWWNQYAKNKLNEFKGWVGDDQAESKVYMANYLKGRDYRSIFDAGCATATFYDTITKSGISMNYTGIDSCTYFVNANKAHGITMIESDIRQIPVPDNTVDICFSRHTFEHQSNFKDIMTELLRISKKEMTHIFFIKPSDAEQINYSEHDNLYHNCYSKDAINVFLSNHSKVTNWTWVEINDMECALHVYLV
jgi:ubiquinone/menaquinone biosynthesis C-methylase UbiE